MSSLLEVRGGSYRIPGGRQLFAGIDLQVTPGEILCVLGLNGVGKTTMLHCITGLRDWTTGQTLIQGTPLRKLRPREVWSHIGFVPQARTNAFAYTVLDMVLLGLSTRIGEFGTPGRADRDRAMNVLARLEIDHLAGRICGALSGGELQMVFIARAFVNEPKLLLLDEPESHLDFKKQLIILELIEKLAQEDGIACIMNTHFPNNALRVASRILLLGPQQRHLLGDSATVLTVENVADYFEVNTRVLDVATEQGTWPALYPVSVVRDDHRTATGGSNE